ncbi:MAG: PKD domain-containing protein [Candidatus Thermoplasmatota archaeon]|nr:PKD domain-containing protein [Candidatus Thermoplasmatota archaeon]
MRKCTYEEQAVSIIIGALMLTVIVVSAATAFAVFTSQKQKELQEAQYASLQRDLEQLAITRISTIHYNSSNHLENISCSIVSLHADDSRIISMSLNGNYLRYFHLTRQDYTLEEWKINSTTGEYVLQSVTDSQGAVIYNGSTSFNTSNEKYSYYPLTVLSRERVLLTIDNASSTSVFLIRHILSNDAITLSVYTSLTNEFSKTFYPPTAIIRLITESQWNSTSNDYESVIILDGSLSDHPSLDAYIVSWIWTVDGNPLSTSGRKIRAPDSLLIGNHNITLSVTDNFGMNSTSTITYP